MSDWQAVFGEIDDDYLIGISNKGIVKRAYKDMETTPCMIAGQSINVHSENAPQDVLAGVLQQALSAEKEIMVQVGEETVQVRLPLGESTCSCPSRSICRHVVQGILALKAAAANNAAAREKVHSESAADETSAGEKVLSESGTDNTAAGENVLGESAASEKAFDEARADSTMIQKVTQQIADYPLEKLCKVLGTRRLQEFISRVRAGKRPQITYSSVAVVQPLGKSMTVRLLHPLEYATCTCHKKEFCVHKAEAVLWCKLDLGQLRVDDLEQAENTNTEFDMDQVRDAARQMRTFLEELLDTGLSRTPQDAMDHMERMAVISHNAKLPDFESSWRRLEDSYQKYMKRVASLRIQTLMQQITDLYGQALLLEQAQGALEISKLAGVFRAEYTSALDLDLVGIASEHFVSRSGYEGDTVYFLEQNTREWYTYTQARPVFYGSSAGAANRAGQYTVQPPWGLTIPFRELAFCHIHLENAKCDSRGRLSSSKETKGQVLAERKGRTALTTEDLGKWFYQDFAQLFQELFQADKRTLRPTGSGQMKLVVLKPASCERAVFIDTEQKLFMNLYDEAGKAVVVEIVYSRDEEEGIRYLENITNENLPCFFGRVYLRDGIIRMYPITVFGKKELLENSLLESLQEPIG